MLFSVCLPSEQLSEQTSEMWTPQTDVQSSTGLMYLHYVSWLKAFLAHLDWNVSAAWNWGSSETLMQALTWGAANFDIWALWGYVTCLKTHSHFTAAALCRSMYEGILLSLIMSRLDQIETYFQILYCSPTKLSPHTQKVPALCANMLLFPKLSLWNQIHCWAHTSAFIWFEHSPCIQASFTCL